MSRQVSTLTVVEAGVGVSIQDAGRPGHRAIGVPVAGAADPVLLACANALLVQEPGCAALEIALVGPSLRAEGGPVQVALAGDFAPLLQAPGEAPVRVGAWQSLTLAAGSTLHIGPCRQGVGYLALAGGCDVPEVLGSRSTYARARLGGIDGRAPAPGDRLQARGPARAGRIASHPWQHAAGPLRIVSGPQADRFDAATRALLASTRWTVSREADRMGLRLEGPPLSFAPGCGPDIISEAVTPGAIQVPGSGLPIVLGVDAQTIGGYAKIATVIQADVPRLAHLRPGSPVQLNWASPVDAQAACRACREALATWIRQLRPAHGLQPDAGTLLAENLISGMIDAWQDPVP